MQTLQPQTLLQGGRYKIIKTLGQGGFGITYLALQSGLERQVAVKEFFMKDFCERDRNSSHVTLGGGASKALTTRFRTKFIKEARNIAKLNHPNIVRIIDIFEENGTAYYVMEYAEGGSLGEKLRNKGNFSKPVATRYIMQVAEAVKYIHQHKMNHLDIKPDNIMLSADDNIILIDFGLAKQYDAETGGQTSTTPVGISEGYAPIEQYKIGGVAAFTPETDIYALGATFFKMLTGITPPSAPTLIEDGISVEPLKSKRVSSNVISLICHAMEVKKKDRISSTSQFIDELKATNDVKDTGEKEEKTQIIHEVTNELNPEMEKAMSLYNQGKYGKAFPLLEKLASQNVPDAIFRLGVCYYWNEGVKRSNPKDVDFNKCRVLMLKAAKLGNSAAMYWLGTYIYENGEGVAKNVAKAREYLQNAVKANNHSAEVALGLDYLTGENVEMSEEKGSSLIHDGFTGLLKDASCLTREEMCILAMCYHVGLGTKENILMAIRWYKKSSDLGDPEAQNALGEIYLKSDDNNDKTRAFCLFKSAASKYLTGAMKNLGDCYMFGWGTEENYHEASVWYRKAAEEGSDEAMFMMGLCFKGGYGQDKDFKKAEIWFTKAVLKSNNVDALNGLGTLYGEGGYGIERNDKMAYYYYKKAADLGNDNSQFECGVALVFGKGVAQNIELGLDYIQKSAEQGNEEAIDLMNSVDELDDTPDNPYAEELNDRLYFTRKGGSRIYYVGEDWSIAHVSDSWVRVQKDGVHIIVTIDDVGRKFHDAYRIAYFFINVNGHQKIIKIYQSGA